MSSVLSRAIGATVGGLIADAAGLPIHWIYNTVDLAAIVSKYDKPEFIPESHCPFYKVPLGSQSVYGDQCYVLLKSLVDNKGLNVDSYKASLNSAFGPGSAYDIDHSGAKPINGPWSTHSLKEFLKNYSENKEKPGDTASKDMDGVCKIGPLVALYAGDPKLLEYVETVVRVTQNNDIAVRFALAGAKLVEDYVLNGPNPQAIDKLMSSSSVDAEAKEAIQDVLKTKTMPHDEVVNKNGLPCAMPGCFKNGLHGVLNATDDFVTSARPTMVAGGDNCSRLLFIGTCLGAQGGFESLPSDWLSKTTKAAEIKGLVEKLYALFK